jgi:hypothetical protein
LLDCGRLEADERSEARAIQMFYITKVDNDATAKRNEGPDLFFYPTRGVTDQLAMTPDCRHFIPVFIFRLLKFIVERTISCHGSAVSFSDSAERLTGPGQLETRYLRRCVIRTVLLELLDHAIEIGIAGAKAPCEPVPAALGNPLAVSKFIRWSMKTGLALRTHRE